jgi:hypothetical protein
MCSSELPRPPLKRLGLFLAAVSTMHQCLLAMDGTVTIESPDTKVALIELFTSEGCSSCPRADAWLGALADESGLWKAFVPVAFHVDYWNQLGWPDSFSSAEFTRRQRNYAARWSATTIYTPEFVFNGEEWLPAGSLPAPSMEKPGKLRVTIENGGQLEVLFFSSAVRTESLVVEIVPLAQGVNTNVARGENAGKRLQHDFVALALVAATLVPSGERVYSARLSLPATTAAPIASIVAWVRPANSAIPIQAAGGWVNQ